MKGGDMKVTKTLALFALFTLAAGTTQIFAHRDFDDRHHSGGEDYNWLCPWCNSYNEYNNMNGGFNNYQDYRYRYRIEFEIKSPEKEEPVSFDQVHYIVDNHLYFLGIPNLKPKEVIEKDKGFDAEIITKDGSFPGMLIIDKQTGLIIDKKTDVTKSPF
jgi:hypothetical protein